MRKVLYATTFVILVFLGFVILYPSGFDSNEVQAQSCTGSGDCNGPIYCNGPCDTLWYRPCNCSCSAQLCNYYDGVVDQSSCYSCGDAQALQWDLYGYCDNCYLCGGSGIKTFDCPDWINPCINICTPPDPTPAPGDPTPTPVTITPTLSPPPPPPPGPPDCRILSGPTNVSASPITIHSYQVEARDSDNNLNRIEIFKSPTATQSWEKIGECNASGGVYSCWGSTTWATPGTYYVICNAYDTSGLQCSGNPFCEWEPNPPSTTICGGSWSDCLYSTTTGLNTDVLTVTVGASCTVDYPDIALNGVGSSLLTGPTTYDAPSGVNNVTFNLETGDAIADFSPNPIYSGVFTTVTANALGGPSTYRAVMLLNDGAACTDTFDVTVDIPAPWCQFLGGSAMANGSISCSVPADPPGMYLMTDIVPGFPGIPIAGGTVFPEPPRISSTNWRAQGTAYGGTLPSYLTFRGKAPTTLHPLGSTADQSALMNFGTQFPSGSGYYYYSYTGNLLLQDGTGIINLNTRKVIVFVDGNVAINSKIQVADGLGFFMIIASGNIIVNPSIGGPQEAPPLIPDLEGVYYTDGTFQTGTNGSGADQQLHVRGVVVAKTGVSMQRSPAVADIPGDHFEFGADQSMLIPSVFSKRTINWREVLP